MIIIFQKFAVLSAQTNVYQNHVDFGQILVVLNYMWRTYFAHPGDPLKRSTPRRSVPNNCKNGTNKINIKNAKKRLYNQLNKFKKGIREHELLISVDRLYYVDKFRQHK